jgi:hypothetical protein
MSSDVLTPDAAETMQEPAVTTESDAANESTPLLCSCGAGSHETAADMCSNGHFVRGNSARRTHGSYAFRDRGAASLPPDLRMTVAEFKSQVICDRGGLDELSAIEAASIGHLTEVETTLRLLASDIARNGLLTKKGRTRTVFGRWLEALDRWERLASHVGDGRRARAVPSLSAYLAQAASEENRR